MERCGINSIIDGGSRRHGTVETRRPMRGDGLAQEDGAVGHRGGVDGRETWHGTYNSTALKMNLWQVAAAASHPAGVLVEEHAGLVGAHTWQAS